MGKLGPYPVTTVKDVALALREIEKVFVDISAENFRTRPGPYVVSNYTESRTLNGGTATLGEVRNFICTLVNDLISHGAIK